MLSENIGVFFSDDFAVAASWSPRNGSGVQTADVILDIADDSLSIGGVEALGRSTSILYPATKLPGLDNGEPITVDGEAYFVRGTPRKLDDGAMMQAWLGKYGNTN